MDARPRDALLPNGTLWSVEHSAPDGKHSYNSLPCLFPEKPLASDHVVHGDRMQQSNPICKTVMKLLQYGDLDETLVKYRAAKRRPVNPAYLRDVMASRASGLQP